MSFKTSFNLFLKFLTLGKLMESSPVVLRVIGLSILVQSNDCLKSSYILVGLYIGESGGLWGSQYRGTHALKEV